MEENQEVDQGGVVDEHREGVFSEEGEGAEDEIAAVAPDGAGHGSEAENAERAEFVEICGDGKGRSRMPQDEEPKGGEGSQE